MDRGLLQRELAQELGVHATTVQFWETGRYGPALSQIPRIIAFLGYIPWNGPPRNFGDKIARARKWLGMTQEDLAREIGVDPCTLARWEKGSGRPSENTIALLEAAFSQT